MFSSPTNRTSTGAIVLVSICAVLIASASSLTRKQLAVGAAASGVNVERYSAPGEPGAADDVITPAGNTIVVNSTADVANGTDGLCTLREAITAANTNTASGAMVGECAAGSSSGSDTISLLGVSGTINLTSALPPIASEMILNGAGADLLTISGNNNFRVFNVTVPSLEAVTLAGLTISKGIAGQGGDGGGIFNNGAGTVNIFNSTLSNNSAAMGGGIFNKSTGTINITNSTLSGNQSLNGDGGGAISNNSAGTINVTNSTLSGNFARFTGGGILNNSTGIINVINSTISNNAAGNYGGGITGAAQLRNSIVALNTSIPNGPGPDVLGAMTSLGHNLIGKNDDSTGFTPGTNNANGDLVGTKAAPLDPLLGPIASNGGPSQTRALFPGSPAIDAGDDCVLNNSCGPAGGSAITTDQRGSGFNRAADGNGDGTARVDIGAYEVQRILVTNTADGGAGSLRQAILDANANIDTNAINFQAGLTGTIALQSALPDLSTSMIINGPGVNKMAVERSSAGVPNFRIFTNPGAVVAINDLTIAKGNLSFGSNGGGGVLNSGTLTMTNCNLLGNTASGGQVSGLYNDGPSLILKNCNVGGLLAGQPNFAFGPAIRSSGGFLMIGGSIVGNSGGGFIVSGGTATLNGVSITNNTANGAGGGVALIGGTLSIIDCLIANNADNANGVVDGAGVYTDGGTTTVVNTTISGNNGSSGNGGGGFGIESGTVTLTNVTITTNRSSNPGGGIRNAFGTVILRNTIVAGNFRGASPSTTADDFSGIADSTSSFNLLGTGGSGGLSNGINNNQVGVSNPGLGPRASNGGPTQTHALLLGSPAVDRGSNAFVTNPPFSGPPFTDQRGPAFNRIVDGPDADTTATVDIGAYEAQVSLADIADTSTNEDTSLVIPFDLGDTSSITSVTVISSNATLVPNNPANISVTVAGSTGVVTINPAANLFGTSDITVTVNRTGGFANRTFKLTVNSVNDAPSFTKGPDQTVNNGVGLQTVNNWATNISPGPSNESGQTTTFSVTGNGNPSLFAVAPAISSTGTLTYRPAANAVGTATITIVLQDNGGSANGGQNTSPAQTFNININPVGGFLKFDSANFSTTESSGFTTITVKRTVDMSQAVSIDYATSGDNGVPCATANGLASSKCDFTFALGTLKFAAGEDTKTFTVLINQDSFVEGPETFTVALSNPAGGAALTTPATATITINDDATEPSGNPIDDARAFVIQHYHDFLNREPDQAGLDFWISNFTQCGGDLQCLQVRRVNVSAAFYLSIEFQGTGYLVERIYKASYGDATGTSTFNGAHQLPVPMVRFNEFLADTQQIGQGVVVGQTGWEQALENNKQVFAAGFVARSRFTTAFPTSMTAAEFVDKLNTNAGNPLSQSERDQLVADLSTNAKTRAQVLRTVAEHSNLVNSEFNRAFVLMQFFGYLRRNPNDPQDTDYTGYDFWLTKLNQFNGNFQNAEMVKAFISAVEYRQRFGP